MSGSSASDSDAESVTGVQLGFAMPCAKPHRLRAEYFPSKMGGQPAWLVPQHVPVDALVCGVCGARLVFLLQLYCPDDEENANGFHRSLHVFVCDSPACHHRHGSDSVPLRVWRAQLPQRNAHYAERFLRDSDAGALPPLPAPDAVPGGCDARVAFPELELVIEEEPAVETLGKEDAAMVDRVLRAMERGPVGASVSDDEARQMEEIAESLARRGGGGAGAGAAHSEVFDEFMQRIRREPDQVLRYERAGAPLWVQEPGPGARLRDVPPCPYCKAPREFEFQIMPQLLHHMRVEERARRGAAGASSSSSSSRSGALLQAIDWGTVAVFTCSARCGGAPGDEPVYREEFVVRQMMP